MLELKNTLLEISTSVLNKLRINATPVIKVKPDSNKFSVIIEISDEKVSMKDILEQNLNSEFAKVLSNEFSTNIIITTKKASSEEVKSSQNKTKIKNIHKIILVAAGKGGVGKSTVSGLVAKSLAAKGFKVGLLDADIHGPSIPTLFNIEGIKPVIQENFFIPVDANGISIMSIGFILNNEGAIAWRSPMIIKALNQLLFSTLWPNLDYLIVDMPPGTGDLHLSMIQNIEVEGAIIVSTPDMLAIKDVDKAIDLYNKLQVKIFGIVENMAYLLLDGNTSSNDNIIYPFGRHGTNLLARKYKLEIIARVPLYINFEINNYNISNFKIDFP